MTKSTATAAVDVTVEFRQGGGQVVNVSPYPAAPEWLAGPYLNAVVTLFYAAKALHALGNVAAAQQVRQNLNLASLLLQRDGSYEPFLSFIQTPGTCKGTLFLGRNNSAFLQGPDTSNISMRDLNDFIADSVLVLHSHTVLSLTMENRQRFGRAFLAMEDFWRTTASPDTLRSVNGAPMRGLSVPA